jgi:hypothetical protein
MALPASAGDDSGQLLNAKSFERGERRSTRPDTSPPKKPPSNLMQRIQQILGDIQHDLQEVVYPDWYYTDEDTKAITERDLVRLSAEKFDNQVEEIARLAKECGKRMNSRYAAVRSHIETAGSPPAAAFKGCKEAMAEIQKSIAKLQRMAIRMREPGVQGSQCYFERHRVERLLTHLSSHAEVCKTNMKMVDAVCVLFESKAPIEGVTAVAPPQEAEALKAQAEYLEDALAGIKKRLKELERAQQSQ